MGDDNSCIGAARKNALSHGAGPDSDAFVIPSWLETAFSGMRAYVSGAPCNAAYWPWKFAAISHLVRWPIRHLFAPRNVAYVGRCLIIDAVGRTFPPNRAGPDCEWPCWCPWLHRRGYYKTYIDSRCAAQTDSSSGPLAGWKLRSWLNDADAVVLHIWYGRTWDTQDFCYSVFACSPFAAAWPWMAQLDVFMSVEVTITCTIDNSQRCRSKRSWAPAEWCRSVLACFAVFSVLVFMFWFPVCNEEVLTGRRRKREFKVIVKLMKL